MVQDRTSSRDLHRVPVVEDEVHAIMDEEGSCVSDGSDEGVGDGLVSKVRAVAPWLGLLAILGCAVSFVVVTTTGATGMAGGEQMHVSTHGVFDAPQFAEILRNQVKLHSGDLSEDQVNSHVSTTITHLKNFTHDNLPKAKATALNNVRLSPEDWADLASIANAMTDKRVRSLGKIVMDTTTENLFAPKEIIEQKVLDQVRQNASDILNLRREMLPARVLVKINDMMRRDPDSVPRAGIMGEETLNAMRRHSTAGRRLDEEELPWVSNTPTVDASSLTLGILSTLFITAGEILMHIAIFWPGFTLPSWVWDLMDAMGQVTGVASCKLGMTFFCDYALGALGLNVVDAIFILICGQVAPAGSAIQTMCKEDEWVLKKVKTKILKLPGEEPNEVVE